MAAQQHEATESRPTDPAGAEMLAFDTYEVLGYRARVGVPEGRARRALRSILGGFGPVEAVPGDRVVPYLLVPAAGGDWAVRVRGHARHTAADFATALAALEWQLLTDALARRRGVFHLHGAALVAPGGGEAIALVGGSGNGKTTLTLGLILRGFAPLSDDVTLLDADTLRARPFPRAFHLEEGTRRILEARDLPADWDFAAMPPGYFAPPRWAVAPTPVRHLIFPRYVPDATAGLTRLDIPAAASLLLENTISLARTPRIALGSVARLTATAGCYRLVSGSLDAALDAIAAVLGGAAGDAGGRAGLPR